MKKCPKCNAEYKDDVVFCTECGTRLDGSESAAKPAPKPTPKPATAESKPADKPKTPFKPSKKLIAICGAALVVVLFIIIIIAKLSNGSAGNYLTVPPHSRCRDSGADMVFIDPQGKTVTVKDANAGDVDFSTGSSEIAVITKENELYYFDGTTAEKIADKVSKVRLSDDGKTVVYNNLANDIYTYNAKKKESTLIARDSVMSACSPDCKSVAYCVYSKEDSAVYGYFNVEGKEYEVGKNRTAVKIANDAEYLCVRRGSMKDYEYTYHVQRKDDVNTAVMLEELKDSINISDIQTNKTVSEFMYRTDSGTWLCVNGEKPVRISGEKLSLKYTGENDYYNRVLIYSERKESQVKSFGGAFYGTESGKVVYLDADFKEKTAAENIEDTFNSVRIADDEKTVFYLQDGALYRTDGTKREEPVCLVESGVAEFIITANGKTVFYTTNDGELYSKKGTGKAKLITENASQYNVGLLGTDLFDGERLFYWFEDELYSTSGGAAEKVETFNHDINSVFSTPSYVCVMVQKDKDGEKCDLYFSTDAKTFELTAEIDS